MHRSRFPFPALLLLLFLLCGCGPLRQEQRQRYFWPPPPGEPKIEYLNYYFSDADLQRGVDRRLEEAILGKSKPVRLIDRPYSVASDGRGRLFVVDFTGSQVHVLALKEHKYRVLARLEGTPQKVTVDSAGEIWVLDGLRARVHHFDADEKTLRSIELTGVGRPASIAVDRLRGRLYVCDALQHVIHLYDLAGTRQGSFGRRGNGPGEFNFPSDLDLDADGNLYVLDAMNARVQILTAEGIFVRAFGERGSASGSFSIPKGIAVSPAGLVYVTDATSNKVVVFSAAGDYLLTFGGRGIFDGKAVHPGGLYFPAGIDVDANETIWIADLLNGIIHEFQYLSPAALAERPIRAEQVYRPHAQDLAPAPLPTEDEPVAVPVTPPQ